MQIINYIVYIKADESGRIIAVNSSAFLLDTAGWTEIDAGLGDKYHHAQGNYFQQPLYDEQGCHNYIYDGTVRPATAEEKAAELAARPKLEPTDIEKLQQENTLLKAQVNALSDNQEFLENCLIEVGQVIYA